MTKILSVFLSLLLVPVLAFGKNACPTLSDQDYVDYLTLKTVTVKLEDSEEFRSQKISGTLSVTFQKDGKLIEHAEFKSKQGAGTFDVVADWSVLNAVLSIHLVSATHSDTGNEKLNTLLDYMADRIMEQPDATIPLNNCDNFKRSLNGISMIMKS
jgi:hypothetical protein